MHVRWNGKNYSDWILLRILVVLSHVKCDLDRISFSRCLCMCFIEVD